MSLRAQFTNDMKLAMKAKEAEKLSVIRMALAKFKEADIEARVKNKEISDADIITILTKMVKQRTESAKTYDDNNRADAAEKERFEISILQNYLPQPLSDAEVTQAIKTTIDEINAASVNDTGKVVNQLKARYAGQIDFGKIVPQIRALLNV